jgi:hypothetical protein
LENTHVICQKFIDEFKARQVLYPKFKTSDVIEMLKRIRKHDVAYCAAEENRVAALQTTNSRYVAALRAVLLEDAFTELQVADILHRVELRLHVEERHDT